MTNQLKKFPMTNITSAVFRLSVLASALALSACGTTAPIAKATDAVKAQTQRTQDAYAKVEEGRKVVVPVYRRVPGLWLSDRFVPSNSLQELPEAFNKTFVLRERKSLAVSDVAEIIRARSGLNVILQGESIANTTLQIDHVGSLRSLVESVSSRLGMTWEWRDNELLIQQSQVQTFIVNRAGLGALKAAVGVGGGAATARPDPYKDLVDAIKVISPNARISILRSSNAITVADKPANMKRISDLIDLDTLNNDKQVMVHWQLVNVTSRAGAEAGLNLNYIMSRSGGKFSVLPASSLNSSNASVIKLDRTSGLTDGSSAALALLNESGVAYIAAENIEPIKHNSFRQFGTVKSITYRSESTPGLASGSNTSASVGIKQSTVEVGLSGNFGASIYDDESLDLMFDFSLKVLDALRTDSSSGYVLQSPETTKRYALAEDGIRIKHGNTYIISAEQTRDISFDRRGLFGGASAVIGGSENALEKNGLWLLLVTPVITKKGV